MIARRVASFREELRAHAASCGRTRLPTIVAVTKTQPPEAVAQAIAAGIEQIGENYLQEARTKFASLPPVRKHFIGHIQTNKAKAIVEAFDVVQSVDRLEVGAALSRAAAAAGRLLPVLVQVNISPADRFGVVPEEAERLAEALRELPGLSLDGVMAIGPLDAARDEILRAFEIAAKTLDRIGGSTLSIGMSGDWREAVGAGSTMLRIGTALFGPRTQR
jgi:hypothetical protein